jgi:apolipoprotein N-acyltransferase
VIPARYAAPISAAASGLALYLAHAPLGWWWTSFAHAPLLVAALWLAADDDPDGRPILRAALLGGLSGAVAFAPMLSWLIAPAGFIGWGLLVGVQVAWMALLGALLHPMRGHPLLPLGAAVVWTGIDAWRGIVPLNGFEWGAIAYAHPESSWLLPVARVLGGRGITFLVVLVGVAGAVALRGSLARSEGRTLVAIDAAFTRRRAPLAQLVGALLASALLVTDAPDPVGTLDVLVVQGNDIRHWIEPVADPVLAITTALRDETLGAIGEGPRPDLVVWPESGVDRDPASPAGARLAPLVDESARAAGELITGTTLDGPDPATQRYVAASRYVDGFDEADRYVKRRLVPFGEFVPARPLFGWFPPLEQVPRDAQPGPGPDAMTLRDGTRVAVIICFETLFPSLVRGNVLADRDPAQLILSITNDASFRVSAEPEQHLAQSRLRAVETGRWVVHGALSGASAFVDPDGRIHDRTDLFERATIRREIPLVDALTPFLVLGDVVGWVTRTGVLALAAYGALGTRGRRTSR